MTREIPWILHLLPTVLHRTRRGISSEEVARASRTKGAFNCALVMAEHMNAQQLQCVWPSIAQRYWTREFRLLKMLCLEMVVKLVRPIAHLATRLRVDKGCAAVGSRTDMLVGIVPF